MNNAGLNILLVSCEGSLAQNSTEEGRATMSAAMSKQTSLQHFAYPRPDTGSLERRENRGSIYQANGELKTTV